MTTSNQIDETDQRDDCFFDALEAYQFHDSDQSTSASITLESSPEVAFPSTTLLRPSTSASGIYVSVSQESNLESSCISSDCTQTYGSKMRYKQKRKRYNRLHITQSNRCNRDRVYSVQVTSKISEDDADDKNKNAKPIQNNDRVCYSVDGTSELVVPSYRNSLYFMSGLVMKAISVQVRLIFKFFTFPLWALQKSFMFFIDPFGAMRRCRCLLMKKLVGYLSLLIIGWLKDQKSILKLLMRYARGTFWSFYVCLILCVLLVFSMMISGSLIINLVDSPVQIKEELHFDYTQNSPVAFVPIASCGGVGCNINCEGKSYGPRVLPPDHKLEVSVLLTLPESEYNRNLGIFQVRVDFLSEYGKILGSKIHLCMLKFKSPPIRFLLNFFKLVPVVTGYKSESQTLEVKIRDFKGDESTSCLKVRIEQRAEFRATGGLPEISDASIILESELPIWKRIIWCWKKTIFVWISIMSFIIELLLTLICCRPAIIPRTR